MTNYSDFIFLPVFTFQKCLWHFLILDIPYLTLTQSALSTAISLLKKIGCLMNVSRGLLSMRRHKISGNLPPFVFFLKEIFQAHNVTHVSR